MAPQGVLLLSLLVGVGWATENTNTLPIGYQNQKEQDANGQYVPNGDVDWQWPSSISEPAGTAPPGWPSTTALGSNQSWPGGFQPPRMAAWATDLKGVPQPCWKVTVLHDAEKGWPGLCLGLFQIDTVKTEQLCKSACWGDPRCSVWQLVNSTDPNQCWIGFGEDCDARGGNVGTFSVDSSQRLQHGSIHIYKSLVGMKVGKLFEIGFFKEGTQALGISRCRDWCYSSISCEYWEYSTKVGCLVDAPSLSTEQGKGDNTNMVQYPLTTAGVETGTEEAAAIIAGEYIAHFCPPRNPTPAADSESSLFYKPKESTGPPAWVWVVAVLLLLLFLALLGYYCLVFAPSRKARDGLINGRSKGYDDDLRNEEPRELMKVDPLDMSMGSSNPPQSFGPPPMEASYQGIPRPESPTRSFQPVQQTSYQPSYQPPQQAQPAYQAQGLPVQYAAAPQTTSVQVQSIQYAAAPQMSVQYAAAPQTSSVAYSSLPATQVVVAPLLNQGVTYSGASPTAYTNQRLM